MKTYREILKENSSDDTDLEFVADQFVNDEDSSDKEMVAHLTKETGLDPKAIKKMVKGARTKVLNKPLASTDDHVKMLKKYM
jgi:predicted DsbA family dithiol-disulfide isomerase